MAPISYSAAAQSTSAKPDTTPLHNHVQPDQTNVVSRNNKPPQISDHPRIRSPSPSQQPKRLTEEEPTYILTLTTDQPHHDRMTALRNKYFPRKLNKLEAHITLFHALPESQLQSSFIPHIQNVAKQSQPFPIIANQVSKLGKRGIAIWLPRNSQGDVRIKELYRVLQEPWRREGWLSEQDSAKGVRPHYTVMNKVDDEGEVDKGLGELNEQFGNGNGNGDEGEVVGLGLWRYDRGWWRWVEGYPFGG